MFLYQHFAEIRVLDNLPITVGYNMCMAEPDVGLPQDYIGDWEILAIGNKTCKRPPNWLYAKLDEKEVIEKIQESLYT